MSYLRSAYTVDMQFDAAGEIVVPIRWYRCQTGALPFPGRHLYGTSTQQPTGFEPIGPGEVLGPATVWNNGDPPAPFTGLGPPCGPRHWWHHGVPSDAPPLELGQWNMPTCCGSPKPNLTGVKVGAVYIAPPPACAQFRIQALGYPAVEQNNGAILTVSELLGTTGMIVGFGSPSDYYWRVSASGTCSGLPGVIVSGRNSPSNPEDPFTFESASGYSSVWKPTDVAAWPVGFYITLTLPP